MRFPVPASVYKRTTALTLLCVLAVATATTFGAPILHAPLPPPQPLDPSTLIDDAFEGSYRAAVKTSAFRETNGDIAIDWTPSTLGTMLDRLNKWDRKDTYMRTQYTWHHTNAPDDRVDEEQHNVRVRGWLKAIKYEKATGASAEGDNDFHIILSNYKNTNANARHLNVEISGLPEQSGDDHTVIRSTREQIAEILGDVNLPSSSYYKPTPAIRVEIEGSLYFDGSHTAGQVGPVGMRPKTVWEIHPVTRIVEP